MDTVAPRHCNACGEAIWHRQAYWEFHCWPRLDPRTYCIDCITHVVFVEPTQKRRGPGWASRRRRSSAGEPAWPTDVQGERSETK